MAGRFDPLIFFDVADHLRSNPLQNKEEACFRTSVGRIYYTAFLLIRNKLVGKSYAISQMPGTGEHEKLINYLKRSSKNVNEFALGALLDSLKTLRRHADYEPQNPLQDTHLESAFSKFQQIKIYLNQIGWYTIA